MLGRHFVILSDHRPLMHLLGESRAVPPLASARIQRWALTLGAYNYSINYKPGKVNSNADVLSHLPLPDSPKSVSIPGETVLLMDLLETSIITAAQIKSWTNRDPVLSKVLTWVASGWPPSTEAAATEDLRPYTNRKLELSVEDGCLLWGRHVVIPPQGRVKLLEELHDSHPGASRMKSLARSYFCGQGSTPTSRARYEAVKSASAMPRPPACATLHPWEWPGWLWSRIHADYAGPFQGKMFLLLVDAHSKWPGWLWSRIHADYAGPFQGKMFLLLVDAHSKWLEVLMVSTATSAVTMRAVFAVHGLPETLVTDNGSVFTSREFVEFTKNGIHHIHHVRSSPYHPASNGLAERAVQTFKAGMKKSSTGSIETCLSRFLFRYRITPHTTTGRSPAEMLMGRHLRSHLDQIRPDVAQRVQRSQERQKVNHNAHARPRCFKEGDSVVARNFSGTKATWVPGEVLEVRGPLTYLIRLEGGRIRKRHVDHIRRADALGQLNLSSSTFESWSTLPSSETDLNPTTAPGGGTLEVQVPELRRSHHTRQPPDRFSS